MGEDGGGSGGVYEMMKREAAYRLYSLLHPSLQLFTYLILSHNESDIIDELIQEIGGYNVFFAQQPYNNRVSHKPLLRRDNDWR